VSRIVSGTLYIDSFVSTGPGEYTFTDAIYENQADPTGAGSLAITPGYILFVNAVDPSTQVPIPGVVIRFKITQIIAADGLHLSAKILWDDEGTQDDDPQNASYALISEPTVYHQFGLPESEIVYPNLQGGIYENAIVKDIRHITDKLGFTGVGVTGMSGTSGTTGFQGLTGIQGYTGLANWLTESYYPTGALAIPLLLWNLNDNALFAYVTGMDAWVQISAGSLQGATGTGSQGITGAGSQGFTGIQGVTGVSPPAVSVGATGLLNIIIDGGGEAISAGIKGDLSLPFDFYIDSWKIYAKETGSILFDIWKSNYSDFPPTSFNAMHVGATGPNIVAGIKNTATTSDWGSPTGAAQDVLRINVDSVSTVQLVSLMLNYHKV
jgi:hypothetical protein